MNHVAVIKPNGSVILKQTEGSNSVTQTRTAVGRAFPVSFVMLVLFLIYIINSDGFFLIL